MSDYEITHYYFLGKLWDGVSHWWSHWTVNQDKMLYKCNHKHLSLNSVNTFWHYICIFRSFLNVPCVKKLLYKRINQLCWNIWNRIIYKQWLCCLAKVKCIATVKRVHISDALFITRHSIIYIQIYVLFVKTFSQKVIFQREVL